MKFTYVDESGDQSQSDVFAMVGLYTDVHRLPRKTRDFDALLKDLYSRHPGSPKELKTKALMDGKGGWKEIPLEERKEFLRGVSRLAVEKGDKIYGIAISFRKYSERKKVLPFKPSYWVATGAFIASIIQKKMQSNDGNKGITVLIVDDNKMEMPKLSDLLYNPPAWFDALYQVRVKKRGGYIWKERTETDRFDHILNTGFSVKSEHSSLVQVSDSLSWTYRRYLELQGEDETEEWEDERAFYEALVTDLETHRIKLGNTPKSEVRDWYEAVKHDDWKL